MKVLLFVFGLCAYASSSYAPLAGHGLLYGGAYGYHGAQHLPVIGPNGVPLEPAANVAARAQHAAAVVEAKARNGDLYGHAGLAGLGYAGAYGHGGALALAGSPALALGLAGHGLAGHGLLAGHGAYLGPQHLPVIGPNGVPLEPAANVAARAQHAHAVAEAQARNGDYLGHAGLVGLGLGHGLVGAGHAGVIGPLGVPLEPAANIAARTLHAAAHAQAAHGAAGHLWRKRRSLAYAVPAAAHGIPVIGPNGVPLELPANVAARVQHAVAVANAQHGNVAVGHANGIAGLYGASPLGIAGVSPLVGYGGIAPLAVHGVPQDTHEVAAAKVAHFAAHAEANARNGVLGGHLGLNGLGLSHGAYW